VLTVRVRDIDGNVVSPTTDLGIITLRKRPVIELRMANLAGVLLPGGVVSADLGAPSGITNLLDNGPHDLDPAPGVIAFRAFSTVPVQACEIQPPAGHYYMTPTCFTAQGMFEQKTSYTLLHAKQPFRSRAGTPSPALVAGDGVAARARRAAVSGARRACGAPRAA
jgi:hypothetical protein